MAATISTHVLDTARGVPAAGIAVELYALPAQSSDVLDFGAPQSGASVASAVTDVDGRTGALGGAHPPGTYELVFRVEAYFAALGTAAFYTAIPVRFEIGESTAKYHVPLLLSPWGYSTYRGS